MIRQEVTLHPNFECKTFREDLDGILVKEYEYDPWGQFHGIYKEAYPNAQPKLHIEYLNGLKHGCNMSWYANGQLRHKGNKFHHTYMGPLYEWFPNGQMRRETLFYHNDKIYGTERIWSPEGVLLSEIQYEGGQKHGVAKYFYETGHIKEDVMWDMGQLIYRKRWDCRGHVIPEDPEIFNDASLKKILFD